MPRKNRLSASGPEPMELPAVGGIRMAAVSAGIKKAGRLDLVLFEICEGAAVAGIFTRNAFRAAPVLLAQKHSRDAAPRWFLVNTGNANAGTGEQGVADALACCRAVADPAGMQPETVLPFSTGVIGEPLPVDKIQAAIPRAFGALDERSWIDAARGIMTTDTRPKARTETVELGGRAVTIAGIAKGAGMLRPDMATMLSFVFTDLGGASGGVDHLLKDAADRSFNRITVDGDTSTNDCCMLVATGTSGVSWESLGGDDAARFRAALERVFVALAQDLVKDGEGATKFVTVRVEEGRDAAECLQLAYTVAESPLVKTALFASDPNWGRILAAVGRAGLEALEINQVEIHLGDVCIVRNGGMSDTYREADGQAVMDRDEILIRIRLGRGNATEDVWTCDLSDEYIRINAEYRT